MIDAGAKVPAKPIRFKKGAGRNSASFFIYFNKIIFILVKNSFLSFHIMKTIMKGNCIFFI